MPKLKDDQKMVRETRIFSSQKMPFAANGLTMNLSFY